MVKIECEHHLRFLLEMLAEIINMMKTWTWVKKQSYNKYLTRLEIPRNLS